MNQNEVLYTNQLPTNSNRLDDSMVLEEFKMFRKSPISIHCPFSRMDNWMRIFAKAQEKINICTAEVVRWECRRYSSLNNFFHFSYCQQYLLEKPDRSQGKEDQIITRIAKIMKLWRMTPSSALLRPKSIAALRFKIRSSRNHYDVPAQ